MIEERTLLTIIAKSTPDQCKEIGELFLSFVNTPRDEHWRAQFRHRLEQFPESSIAIELEQARLRVVDHLDQGAENGQ